LLHLRLTREPGCAPFGWTESCTTTTLPDDGCGLLPTYASAQCRLEQLAAAIAASDAGPLASKLTMRIKGAAAAVAHAEQVLGRRHGHASRAALWKAGKSLAAYGKLLGSKKAQHSLSDETRSALEAPLGGLRATVQALPTSP
jgi:hypothetical protein